MGVTSLSLCISAGSSASIWGRQCLCLLPLSRRSVQLWWKQELISGLLMPSCFVFSPVWSGLSSVDGALSSLECLKVESHPEAPDTRSPTSTVGWRGGGESRLISLGPCRCVLSCQDLARCSGLVSMWIDRGLWLGWLQVVVAVGVLWVSVRMLIYLTGISALWLVNPIVKGQDPVFNNVFLRVPLSPSVINVSIIFPHAWWLHLRYSDIKIHIFCSAFCGSFITML